MPPEYWRVLAKGHERRNLAEYEGYLEHDERLLADLTETAERLHKALTSLPPAEWSDEYRLSLGFPTEYTPSTRKRGLCRAAVPQRDVPEGSLF